MAEENFIQKDKGTICRPERKYFVPEKEKAGCENTLPCVPCVLADVLRVTPRTRIRD